MNRNGGILGQILSSPIALILVFVIMLLFVVVASFSSINGYEDYSLIDDFLDDPIIFEGKAVMVREVILRWCDNESLGAQLNIALRKHFTSKYGEKDVFVITSAYGASYRIHAWKGVFESLEISKLNQIIGIVEFEKIFPRDSPFVNKKSVCDDVLGSVVFWHKRGLDES